MCNLSPACTELFIMYMLYTDVKSVSSMYRVIYHICMSLLGLSVAHTEFCIIYMLFTASFRSVCSTYRVILYYYVYFLQPILGLPLAHIELILQIYEYMPFTDLKSASSMYVLAFYGMPPLKFLGHTTFLC